MESKLQAKILRYLIYQDDCWAIKAESVTRGIPDIICCYRGKFIGFEVKSEQGELSEIQKATGELIDSAGGIYRVVRTMEDVKRILCILE